jgi:hypothetical protein
MDDAPVILFSHVQRNLNSSGSLASYRAGFQHKPSLLFMLGEGRSGTSLRA